MNDRKEQYQQNKEEILEQRKKYYEQNKEKILEKRRKRYQQDKEKINEYNRQQHAKHKESRNAQKREYYQENREKLLTRQKECNKEHPEIKHTWNQSLKGKWSAYRTTAKRRRLVFDLTFEQFSSFWQQPCHYCGCVVDTICLDRIDSSKGYTIDNVVPSCLAHNIMKLDKSKDEFIALCRAVVDWCDI